MFHHAPTQMEEQPFFFITLEISMNYIWELGKQKCVESEHDIYYPQSEITYGSGRRCTS